MRIEHRYFEFDGRQLCQLSISPPREERKEREKKRTVKLKSGKQQQKERERERNDNIAYLLRRRERSPHHNFCFVLIRVCVNLKTDVDFEKKSPFLALFEIDLIEGETRVCNIFYR